MGASAGGLEAFEQFLRAMPADSGLAFVLVQHLDPSHASILSEILQRSTDMPVVEAQDGVLVAPNHVYVIPPNRDMVIFHGALQLSVPNEPRGQRMPIDAFLRSLAEDQADHAVGIVLSGTGTDGTLGLRAIFGAGGLCLVQEPATAKYDGMPVSAIHSGYTTHTLPVEQMPQVLRSGTRAKPRRADAELVAGTGTGTALPPAASGMTKILMLMRAGTGHDFTLYKKSTIGRRIERRMNQHNIEDSETYARFLRKHPAEMQTLFRELLINVTSFFRDPMAFATLKAEVLPALLAGKSAEHVLRIWVAGCATGEEAYSIAMLLRETMEETHRDFKVQMYATDLDDDAIATARAGLYPPNIAQDVTPERLRRFFHREDAGYRVRKDVRDMVVFAVQSVIKDPPFTRLDLLSCRNLMIYLEPELQHRLIPTFHYALKPGGVLFLSPSESIGNHTDLFETIDRKWKIYRSKPTSASTRAVLTSNPSWTMGGKTPASAPDNGPANREVSLADFAKRALLQTLVPAAVVTNLQGNVLYVHGDTGKYLRPAPGSPTHSLVAMAREGLAGALQEALHLAAMHGQPTLNRELQVGAHGDLQPVALSLRLLPEHEAGQNLLLVSFQDLPALAPTQPLRKPRARTSGDAQRIAALELDLSRARENMSAMLEEQQASNEELKSANEELQSTNEELQSTNEELETSKEELQSVNEELVTVNSELQTKVELMVVMQDDMKNLLDNIRLGLIFLDRHLRIRRFTRDATQVYRLLSSDVGRPLADMRCELLEGDLLSDAEQVLETLVPLEREVHTAADTWYLARVQPYRTLDNVIDGVVLTFADVTEQVHALAARRASALAKNIVDTVRSPLAVLDGALKMVTANRSFYQTFGGSPQDHDGINLFAARGGYWDNPVLRELLEKALPIERKLDCRVVDHVFPGLGARRLVVSASKIVDQPGDGDLVLVVFESTPPAGS